MNLTVTLKADAKLLAALNGLGEALKTQPASVGEALVERSPLPTDPTANPSSAPAEPAAPAESAEGSVVKDDVLKALKAVADKIGKADAIKILNDHGARNLMALEAQHYASVVKVCNTLLGADDTAGAGDFLG